MDNRSAAPPRRSLAKRLLLPPLIALATLLVFLEETLIDFLSGLMARLARLPVVTRAEAWATRLPPYWAMTMFLLPAAVLLPFKFLALWLLASGHALSGILIIVTGKIVGTALSARIYKILHPALATLPWFVRAETWVFAKRDWLYGWVKATHAWQAMGALKLRVRAAIAQRRSWIGRYLRRMRAKLRAG